MNEDVDGRIVIFSEQTELELANAKLKYHLVLSGYSWSKPISMPRPISQIVIGLRDGIGEAVAYNQFSEPFSMLSEINSTAGLLEIFMSTYHALENYMIRSQIAATFSNGDDVNIQRVRDFKRLGGKIDQSEAKFLFDLFDRCKDMALVGETWVENVTQAVEEYKGKFEENAVELGAFLKNFP